MAATPSTLSYSSHLLVGQRQDEAKAQVLVRWDYPPSQTEMQAAIDGAEKVFASFVLVTPCGPLLPGNYAVPVNGYDGCD